jgi:spore coat polysaccharide biosynthesis protein SpsF
MINKEKKVIATIQARLGSKRMPKKVLRKILNKTMIEWINYRLSFCNEVDEIVLITSELKENDPLIDLADSIGLQYYRGSEEDLISRHFETVKKFKADALIRITGDCPLVDPVLVDKMVKEYRENHEKFDYVCNVFPATFPDGLDIDIIPFSTLERLNAEVKDPLYREWITTTLVENPKSFRIKNITNNPDLSNLRLTLDYEEDFELINNIFTKLHKDGKVFILKDILELFKKEPDLAKINEKRIDSTVVNNFRSKEFQNLKQDSLNNL